MLLWPLAVFSLYGCATTRLSDNTPRVSGFDSAAVNSTLIRVIDGDTIMVLVDGIEERVRLVGIDTPEKGLCGFEEATEALELLLAASTVGLVDAGVADRDRYGRLLRYLDINGSDPGLELIRSGLASAAYDSRSGYPKHSREDAYLLADAESSGICE